MTSQLEQLVLDKAVPNERDERLLESDLKKMGNYTLFMRNLLANGNDDEIMNMYDHLVRYVNDISGRNPFWLDNKDHATPTVSLQSEASDDILENSVDRLVKTCLGELIVPTLQADQFELVLEQGKVSANRTKCSCVISKTCVFQNMSCAKIPLMIKPQVKSC